MASPLPKSRSQSPVRTPKLSPQRKALHERTQSQTNISSPTIRLVDDSDDSAIYSRSPFPSLPSQVLLPQKKPGYVFEDRDAGVSDENAHSNAQPKSLMPTPLQPRRSGRMSDSTASSYTDSQVARSASSAASVFSPASTRFSQGTYSTPPSSPREGSADLTGLDVLQEEPSRSSIRVVIPSSPPEPISSDKVVRSRQSEASLASSASSDTIAVRIHEHRQGSSQSSLALSPQNPNRPGSAASNKKRTPRSGKRASKHRSRRSREAFAQSNASGSSLDRPRSASTPILSLNTALKAPAASGPAVQYPVVRPPSASSSWAESSSSLSSGALPKATSKMADRPQRQPWSPNLSVIVSESDRTSRSMTESSRRHWIPQRQRTINSTTTTSEPSFISSPSETSIPTSIPVPAPLFSSENLVLQGRESDEQEDVLYELQSPPPLRHQRSGYRERYSERPVSRPGSVQSDVGSERSSFYGPTFVQSFPVWARRYYSGDHTGLGFFSSNSDISLQRINSMSSSRLDTSASNRSFPYLFRSDSQVYVSQGDSRLQTGRSAQSGPSGSPNSATFPFSFSIFHPRKRPRGPLRHQDSAASLSRDPTIDSLAIESLPDGDRQPYVVGRPRRHFSEQFFPRLGKDRRTANHISAWRAPSFDETLSPLFTRVNRQIALFCLGFIFPLAWMIAAVLPLPELPALHPEATESQMDVEQAISTIVDPMEEKRYWKARWWRNLNRIMTPVGLLIIGAIIALAVIGSRGW